MTDDQLDRLSAVFLALSDKTRLRLLALMSGGEVSVGLLTEALKESQPKVSRHLAYLRSAGIVSTRRDGKWIYYAIDDSLEPAAAAVITAALGQPAYTPAGLKNSPTASAPEIAEYIYADTDVMQDSPSSNEIDIFLL